MVELDLMKESWENLFEVIRESDIKSKGNFWAAVQRLEVQLSQTETIKTVTEFFKRRFPESDIEFEKKTGYFYEWVERFVRGPEGFMDETSKRVWEKMKEEGWK